MWGCFHFKRLPKHRNDKFSRTEEHQVLFKGIHRKLLQMKKNLLPLTIHKVFYKNSIYNLWWKCHSSTRARKKTVSILSDEFCEEQVLPDLLPKINLVIKLLEIFQQVLFDTLVKTLISTLHQMQIMYYLQGLYMNSTTYINQYTLLCTWLNKVHSQLEQLKVTLIEPLKGLL